MKAKNKNVQLVHVCDIGWELYEKWMALRDDSNTKEAEANKAYLAYLAHIDSCEDCTSGE